MTVFKTRRRLSGEPCEQPSTPRKSKTKKKAFDREDANDDGEGDTRGTSTTIIKTGSTTDDTLRDTAKKWPESDASGVSI